MGGREPGKSSPPCKSDDLEMIPFFLHLRKCLMRQLNQFANEAELLICNYCGQIVGPLQRDSLRSLSSFEESANANDVETTKVIFHVDMDSFYASCELASKPEFKEKPFIVGADPKDGKGRGVVLTCNYAARKFGVHSAMPISRAWELCPHAIYVRPNFDLYTRVSSNVFDVIRQYADRVEQVSIDEAYLDVTEKIEQMAGTSGWKESAIRELADSIRSKIKEAEKITCSIGVSNSKIVAKIATDVNKPDGTTIIPKDKVPDFLTLLPVGKIPGVGKVTEGILSSKFKVKSIGDLRAVPIDQLEDSFGRSALWLHDVSCGIDRSDVVEHWEHVSLSGETTFEADEPDYSKVSKVMKDVALDVHKRALEAGYLFKNVGIKVRFSGFETHTRSKSLKTHTDSLDVLNQECEKLLSEFYRSGKKVRLIGVRVSNLSKTEKDQASLLQWEK